MKRNTPRYHAVQFYKDETTLAEAAAHFLAEGLKSGQPALVIATSAHRAKITEGLLAHGLDADELKRSSDLMLVDARKALSMFMSNNVPDAARFRESMGRIIEKLCDGRSPCPIRAYGEMVDVLWQAGNSAGAIRLEVLWNKLAQDREFSLLCGYSVGHFYKETTDPMALQEICDQHTYVLPLRS